MTKIALITDTHWGVRGDSSNFHDYFKRFYDEVFFPKIDELGIKTIVHLGDIVDRRKFINFMTGHRLNEDFLNKCYERDIDLHIIIGNHDTYYKNTNKINACKILFARDSWPKWYESAEEVVIGGVKILFVPWVTSENYQDTIRLIDETDASILMGHLEIAGFEMHRGAMNEAGFSKKSFEKFDMVLSGHFHHKSTIDQITYLGSPYDMTWSDFGDTRGFHVYDSDEKQLTFIKNPFNMFNKVVYDDSSVKDIKELTREFDYSYIRGTYVKLIVKDKMNPYWFDLFIDHLNKFEPADLQVVEDNMNFDLTDEEDIIDSVEDTSEFFKKYINNLGLEDPAPLQDLFASLYSDALSIE